MNNNSNNSNKTLGDFPGADPVLIRLYFSVQGVWVRSLEEKLRSHMPRGQKHKTEAVL